MKKSLTAILAGIGTSAVLLGMPLQKITSANDFVKSTPQSSYSVSANDFVKTPKQSVTAISANDFVATMTDSGNTTVSAEDFYGTPKQTAKKGTKTPSKAVAFDASFATPWLLVGDGRKQLYVNDTDGDGFARRGNDVRLSLARTAVGGNRRGNSKNLFANQHSYGIGNSPFTGVNSNNVINPATIAAQNGLSYASVDRNGNGKNDLHVTAKTQSDLDTILRDIKGQFPQTKVLSKTRRADKHARATRSHSPKRAVASSNYQVPKSTRTAEFRINNEVARIYQAGKTSDIKKVTVKLDERGHLEIWAKDYMGSRKDVPDFIKTFSKSPFPYNFERMDKGPGNGVYLRTRNPVMPSQGRGVSLAKSFITENQKARIPLAGKDPVHMGSRNPSGTFYVLNKENKGVLGAGGYLAAAIVPEAAVTGYMKNPDMRKANVGRNAGVTLVASQNPVAAFVDYLANKVPDLKDATITKIQGEENARNYFSQLTNNHAAHKKHTRVGVYGFDYTGDFKPDTTIPVSQSSNRKSFDTLKMKKNGITFYNNNCGQAVDIGSRVAFGMLYTHIGPDPKPKPKPSSGSWDNGLSGAYNSGSSSSGSLNGAFSGLGR